HCKGITTNSTDVSKCSSSHFASHGSSQINSKVPVEGLINQRHGVVATTAKNKSSYGHTSRVVPIQINNRILDGRDGKSRIRMSRGFTSLRIPFLTLPINKTRWRIRSESFPPNIFIRRN